MKKTDLVRVFTPGGVLSPSDLNKILGIAQDFDNKWVHFGSRQDILFGVNETTPKELHALFKSLKTDFEYKGEKYQNISTSYVAFDIQPATSWLTSSTYHYIMETFDYRPSLKINITDPKQSLVPLFSGNLNFVASQHYDYWYLYLNFPGQEQDFQIWPVLIFSYDIAKVAKAIEDIYVLYAGDFMENLFQKVNDLTQSNNRNYEKILEFPMTPFSSYEGLNKMAGEKYWLGLYWRNNNFSIDFLQAVCQLCSETKVGNICITPWKSFIVKGIASKDRLKWEKLLGKYGINMRHSSLELNWHLPVLDEEALQLKRYLVKNFDQNDISTEGLTFTVKTSPLIPFTSIIIEQKQISKFAAAYDLIPTYNVLFAKDFNPNTRKYINYAKDVVQEDLAPLLMELSKLYYEQLDYHAEVIPVDKPGTEPFTMEVHQCGHCMTVYDAKFGEPEAGIEVGTLFADLPDAYICSLCEASKDDFQLVTLKREAV
ncbi:MAG: rubredoxin [Bacteroidota bacterium]|nr:rubredoxin [Bacteroidota bacterium]